MVARRAGAVSRSAQSAQVSATRVGVSPRALPVRARGVMKRGRRKTITAAAAAVVPKEAGTSTDAFFAAARLQAACRRFLLLRCSTRERCQRRVAQMQREREAALVSKHFVEEANLDTIKDFSSLTVDSAISAMTACSHVRRSRLERSIVGSVQVRIAPRGTPW